MVFNVLWLSAVAAASALAGFCMGRLSVRAEEYGEEAALAVGDGAVSGNYAGRRVQQAEARHIVRVESVERVESAQGALQDIPAETPFTAAEAGETRETQPFRRTYTGTAGWISDRVIRGTGGAIRPLRRGVRGKSQQEPKMQEWSVGSPASGWITSRRDGDHPMVVIQPDEDRLYSPAAGKIIKLFPMGNAFLFRTDFGVELYIQVGNVGDDLMGRYFRPRVVQNEIMGKGKLLLEFDTQGLVAEGISPAVTVRVESLSYTGCVYVTAPEQVTTGAEIMLAKDRQSQGVTR